MVTKKMMEIKKEKRNARLSINLFLNFLSFLCLFSCSQRIQFRTPMNQIISPETSGELFKGEADAYISMATVASFDLDNSVDKIDELEISRRGNASGIIGLNGSMGVIEKLDLVLQSSGSDYPTLAGVNFQILGKSRKEAGKGNHSLSLTPLYGRMEDTGKNDESFELIPEDDEAEFEREMEAFSIRLTYGYRFAERRLIYAGISHSTLKFSGTLTSKRVEIDGINISNKSVSKGVHTGIVFYGKSSALHMKIEAAGQHVKWDNTDATTVGSLTGSIGLNWN